MAKEATNSVRSMNSVVSKDDPGVLDPVVVKNLQRQAYKMIEKSLDIVTLVKEINSLKVLTHFLLKDYHLKLVPLISLSLQCSKTGANLFGGPDKKAQGISEYQISRQKTVFDFGNLGFKKLSFQVAMEKLQASMQTRTDEASVKEKKEPAINNLDQRIDLFCFESLAGGQAVFSELLNLSKNRQRPSTLSELEQGPHATLHGDPKGAGATEPYFGPIVTDNLLDLEIGMRSPPSMNLNIKPALVKKRLHSTAGKPAKRQHASFLQTKKEADD
jgi:hypothetical protein